MVKRKFGASVRAKTPAAQVNEVLLKCLCHNLACSSTRSTSLKSSRGSGFRRGRADAGPCLHRDRPDEAGARARARRATRTLSSRWEPAADDHRARDRREDAAQRPQRRARDRERCVPARSAASGVDRGVGDGALRTTRTVPVLRARPVNPGERCNLDRPCEPLRRVRSCLYGIALGPFGLCRPRR